MLDSLTLRQPRGSRKTEYQIGFCWREERKSAGTLEQFKIWGQCTFFCTCVKWCELALTLPRKLNFVVAVILDLTISQKCGLALRLVVLLVCPQYGGALTYSVVSSYCKPQCLVHFTILQLCTHQFSSPTLFWHQRLPKHSCLVPSIAGWLGGWTCRCTGTGRWYTILPVPARANVDNMTVLDHYACCLVLHPLLILLLYCWVLLSWDMTLWY